MTIGIDTVALLAAKVAAGLDAMITSTLRRTRSAASSSRPSAYPTSRRISRRTSGEPKREHRLGTSSPPAAPQRSAPRRGHQPARSAGSGGGSSLDHLVRPQQQRRRDRQIEGLGGLEIDDQLELGGLLDGQVSGSGAPEDPVYVPGSTPRHVDKTRAVCHETTRLHEVRVLVNRGQADLRSELREAPALQPEHRMRMDEECLQPCGTRCCEGGAYLIRSPSDEELDLQTQACGFTLDGAVFLGDEGGDSTEPGQGVLEQLKSLPRQLAGQVAEAGHVSARPGQARDQAPLFRVGDPDEHDGHRRGRLLEGLRELVGADHDDVDTLPDQVPRCVHHLVALVHGAAGDEDVVPHLDVPELPKPVLQREQHGRTAIAAAAGRHAGDEKSDAPDLPRLLRLAAKRASDATSHRGQQKAAAVHAGIVGQALVWSQTPRISLPPRSPTASARTSAGSSSGTASPAMNTVAPATMPSQPSTSRRRLMPVLATGG